MLLAAFGVLDHAVEAVVVVLVSDYLLDLNVFTELLLWRVLHFHSHIIGIIRELFNKGGPSCIIEPNHDLLPLHQDDALNLFAFAKVDAMYPLVVS